MRNFKKNTIRLTESDLIRIVKRIINEGVELEVAQTANINTDVSAYANQNGTWKVDGDGESIDLMDSEGKSFLSVRGENYGKKTEELKKASLEKTNSFKPEEITNFLKNGGNVEQNGKIITSPDNKKGFKFQKVDNKGNVLLDFSTGEGKLLIIDPNSKKYSLFNRSAMTDQWVNDGKGSISFDGSKIILI